MKTRRITIVEAVPLSLLSHAFEQRRHNWPTADVAPACNVTTVQSSDYLIHWRPEPKLPEAQQYAVAERIY